MHSVNPRSDQPVEWSRITERLASAMPSFGVSGYFAKKQALLSDSDIIVIVHDSIEDEPAGFLAASWSKTTEPRFLYIRTLLIAEQWHRSQVIHLIYRRLFENILDDGHDFPPVIVFKTYNPKSFAAMAAFRRVPGATVYPFINGVGNQSVLPHVRAIAAELAPGSPLDEATGVLAGAADGVTDFYATMPLSGTEWIDTHFQRHVTPADRMLACLFTGGQAGAARILRAFGVRRGNAAIVPAVQQADVAAAPRILSASS